MRLYEVMYILDIDLDEETGSALMNRFNELITEEGGVLTKAEAWGRRRLAYEINRKRDGFYVVLEFKGKSEVADELNRVFSITDGVLRHMVTRKDH